MTHSRTPRSRLIWAKGSLPNVPRRFRAIFTVLLPLKYVMFTAFGIAAMFHTPPTLAAGINDLYGSIWSVAITVFSAASLVALALQLRVELYTTLCFLFAMVSYPTLAFIGGLDGNVDRGTLAFAISTFLLLPGWRYADLLVVEWKRKQAERALAALRARSEAEGR
jgi:hypothetical protein